MPDDHAVSRQVIEGRVRPGDPDWVYVPVELPPAVARLTVRCRYDRALGVIDLGLFGPGGRFRGWSGGARSEFTLAGSDATPGYLAGPLPAGTWQVILGPYLERLPAALHNAFVDAVVDEAERAGRGYGADYVRLNMKARLKR